MRKLVPISNCVAKVLSCNPAKAFGEDLFTYIDISSVNSIEKAIRGGQSILGADAPSRARQMLQEGDVLVSTVRPNLNAVALVNREYDGSIASTGFCVLRPKKEILNSRYLFYWVRAEAFVSEMVKKATGANYPAVSDSTVKSSLIPLPPLHIQEQIADTLDKADALRRKDQELLEQYDKLAQAIFYDMFGDPVKNERKWEAKKICDIATLINGDRSSQYPSQKDIVEAGIPFYSVTDVLDGELTDTNVRFITEKKFGTLSQGKLMKGDLVITLRGSGSGTVYRFDSSLFSTGFINAQMMIIRVGSGINHQFLLRQLSNQSNQNKIRSIRGGSAIPQITGKQIADFKVIIPPVHLQNRFVDMISSVKEGRINVAFKHSELLFYKLLQYHFQLS